MTFRKFLPLLAAALMVAGAADSAAQNVSVPMLRHSVKPGEAISASDLVSVAVDQRRVNYQSVRRSADIVGLAARRPLGAGRQLRLSDFEEPAVVRKGSRVTMVLATGGLRLTAMGIAMEDGGENAFIKIKNSETRQMVHAKVIAPNLVEVLPMGQLALR